MTARCANCGQEWERDPALEVERPICKAPVGRSCRRPSGHVCPIHAKRDLLAMRELQDYGRCPAAQKQLALF